MTGLFSQRWDHFPMTNWNTKLWDERKLADTGSLLPLGENGASLFKQDIEYTTSNLLIIIEKQYAALFKAFLHLCLCSYFS